NEVGLNYRLSDPILIVGFDSYQAIIQSEMAIKQPIEFQLSHPGTPARLFGLKILILPWVSGMTLIPREML
ncbi:MAG: hypothetical protein KGL39_59910, partial [Patescibacteria group bacterium]|nr:hypothetical protein [Patescibacteria group bacterium]